MLTSQSQKELYGEFERQRNKALMNPSDFPATGQRYALDDLGVNMGDGGVNNKEAFLIDTNPVDGTPKTNRIDIRFRPGVD